MSDDDDDDDGGGGGGGDFATADAVGAHSRVDDAARCGWMRCRSGARGGNGSGCNDHHCGSEIALDDDDVDDCACAGAAVTILTSRTRASLAAAAASDASHA